MPPPTNDEIVEEEQAERESLTAWILANRTMQTETAKSEKLRFSNARLTSIETLRTIKANIEAKRLLETKSVPELRQLARGNPPSRWKPVPQIYRNRSMLLSLASENTQEFRRLLQVCGNDALQAILDLKSEDE